MLPFKIAVRFLRSNPGQTILIISGIAVGVSIQLFVGLLIGSLQRSLIDGTVGNAPHITITSATDIKNIRNWDFLISEIKRTGSVRAVAASATGNLVIRKDSKDYPVTLRGFYFNEADRIYKLSSSLYSGKPYGSGREALVGKELADELDIKAGDRITLTVPDGENYTLTVSGLFDLGTANLNRTWVITGMRTTQQILDIGNRVTSLEMAVDDVFEADNIAKNINTALNNPDLEIKDWKNENQQLLSALDSQGSSSAIIQVVIIVSVVIAIGSVLAISVLQKSRQIGILKAMGIKDNTASLIFVYQGLLLGVFGALFGIALGLGLLYSFNAFAVGPDGVPVVPIYFDGSFILRSWFIAMTAAILAGLIPARRSLNLNPIDIIREG